MIITKQKPLEEIRKMLAGYDKILILGCGTCSTVCFAGGEREVAILASSLRMAEKIDDKEKTFFEHTVKRQCDWEFLDEIAEKIKEADVILSLSCGVGVQAIAERFPNSRVLPGIDTCFLGLTAEPGIWSERCDACGHCLVHETGGICPIARCAKGLFNGPCGGSVEGKCEISPDVPCAWQLIIDHLAALGQLDKLETIQPPKDWRTSHSGGPRKIVSPVREESGEK